MPLTSRCPVVKSLPAIALLLTLVPGAEAAAAAARPNFVYIMLDEWAYFELSCMGHKQIETPNIDRMAAEGMRFTQALAGGNVCAPTRSVLMMGQHSGHCSRRNSG